MSINAAKTYIKRLQEKLEILREKNGGILALVRHDEIDEEIKQSDILHEEATRIIVHIEGVLEKLTLLYCSQPLISVKNYQTLIDLFEVFVGNSAAEAIAELKLTSLNYAEAIAILEKRFGDKQLIIKSHMDAMVMTRRQLDSSTTR
ncbi:Hypothetical predicted protein [Paramuricea clavata]|uniref:Uncharacterized protein n=1 Tax=Paramuricea clavata TaxID=317549 RepID=A0A6S7IT14_PARCT|nr:Hypothetical predicted protein [Paramuricea clavata]